MTVKWVTLITAVLTLLRLSRGSNSYFGPPADGLDWIDNTLIEEPADGSSRWWHAPSRKAPIYTGKYLARLQRETEIASAHSAKVGENLRLPTDLVPVSYNVRLLPYIEPSKFTSDGHVEIVFDCVRSTTNVTLSANGITIKAYSLAELGTNNPLQIGNLHDEQDTRQMITMESAIQLEAGKRYRVIIDFISFIYSNQDMFGFYWSSYVENGVTKYLAVTQFEDVDARRAFPCFDEPNMKATFSITLGRRSSWTSASNMPINSTVPIAGMPGYEWDIYPTTPKMSPYLVAFLVSEFVAVPSVPGNGRVPFRLWTRPDFVNQTEYCLDVAPKMQDYFENLFNINYVLPKQDVAGIPQFAAGAMENWGLITYREIYVLVNRATDPRSRYQNIAAVNAHELAHQWTGNLVTCSWWSHIWLNEGFATYLEWLGAASVEPTWLMEEQQITTDLQYVFGADGLETSRPIVQEVTTPNEISSMFDAISYEKGGCINRMMANFLGFPTFIRGLTRYMNSMAYLGAVQDDLWRALQQQVDFEGVALPTSVKQIMDTWTLQMGYPLITVIRNYTTGTAVVSQERFLWRKTEGIDDPKVYRWWVPLNYVIAANPLQKHTDWLSSSEQSKTISIAAPLNSQWALFNIDQQNYYRVAYDETNYALLSDQLLSRHVTISSRNRAQLLDDAFNLALANKIPYNVPMDLSRYLKYEREYVPWRAVLTELDYIDIMLRLTPAYDDLKIYLSSLIRPYYEFVGFVESALDAHLTIYRRIDALNWACRLDVSDCVPNAKQRYAALMNQPNLTLSSNQWSLILRTGVEYGGKAEWNFAFDRYKVAGDTTYLVAMAYTKQSSIVYNMLEMILNPNSGIRQSDIVTLFNNIAASPLGHPLAFNFLYNRWDDIGAALGNGYYVSFFYALRNRLNTQDQLNKYIKLRDDHMSILGSLVNVRNAITTATENVKWMGLHEEEISLWLKRQPTEASTAPTTMTTTAATTTTAVQTTTSIDDTTTTTTAATTTTAVQSTTSIDDTTTTTTTTTSTTQSTSTTSWTTGGSSQKTQWNPLWTAAMALVLIRHYVP